MRDTIVVVALVVAFAWVVTTHVTIVVGLLRRTPRWRAVVAVLVPVLGPYWAWREGMRVRAGLWTAGAVVYVVARVAASLR